MTTPHKMEKQESEEWYAILGTVGGIVSVHSNRKEANAEHKELRCTKNNRIVRCTITYTLPAKKKI